MKLKLNIFYCLSLSLGSWWCRLPGHSSGGSLLWGQWGPKPGIDFPEPFKSPDCPRGLSCNGWTYQPTSSNLPFVWTDLCTPLGVPKMHEKHLQLYSANNAELRPKWPVTQTSKAEKWSCSVGNIYDQGWSFRVRFLQLNVPVVCAALLECRRDTQW